MSESRMVTLASVTRRVNRTPQTLPRWAETGEFPHAVLLNGRRYLFEHEVTTWLDRTRTSTRGPLDDYGTGGRRRPIAPKPAQGA